MRITTYLSLTAFMLTVLSASASPADVVDELATENRIRLISEILTDEEKLDLILSPVAEMSPDDQIFYLRSMMFVLEKDSLSTASFDRVFTYVWNVYRNLPETLNDDMLYVHNVLDFLVSWAFRQDYVSEVTVKSFIVDLAKPRYMGRTSVHNTFSNYESMGKYGKAFYFDILNSAIENKAFGNRDAEYLLKGMSYSFRSGRAYARWSAKPKERLALDLQLKLVQKIQASRQLNENIQKNTQNYSQKLQAEMAFWSAYAKIQSQSTDRSQSISQMQAETETLLKTFGVWTLPAVLDWFVKDSVNIPVQAQVLKEFFSQAQNLNKFDLNLFEEGAGVLEDLAQYYFAEPRLPLDIQKQLIQLFVNVDIGGLYSGILSSYGSAYGEHKYSEKMKAHLPYDYVLSEYINYILKNPDQNKFWAWGNIVEAMAFCAGNKKREDADFQFCPLVQNPKDLLQKLLSSGLLPDYEKGRAKEALAGQPNAVSVDKNAK